MRRRTVLAALLAGVFATLATPVALVDAKPGSNGGGVPIGTGAITTDKLADGAVTADKLGAGAVSSAHILDGTVTPADLSLDYVTHDELAQEGFATTASLESYALDSDLDGLLTAADLEPYATTNDLASLVLGGDRITDGSIGTADLARASVTADRTQASYALGQTSTVNLMAPQSFEVAYAVLTVDDQTGALHAIQLHADAVIAAGIGSPASGLVAYWLTEERSGDATPTEITNRYYYDGFRQSGAMPVSLSTIVESGPGTVVYRLMAQAYWDVTGGGSVNIYVDSAIITAIDLGRI